jgi:predicted N-acetyltransferase YhbS
MMSIVYRKPLPGEAERADALAALCFGPGRFAKSAYRLREGVRPVDALSLVAVDGEVLCGTIQYWPIAIGARSALLLGPLAVDPKARGQGVGIELMRLTLDSARAAGHRAVILVGDVSYYGRVGFRRLEAPEAIFPGPVDRSRLLGLALAEGGVDGLSGEIMRTRRDEPVAAAGCKSAPLAASFNSAPLAAPGH